jgi:outer membrane protein TolC
VGNNSNQYYLGSELYGQLTFSWTIFDGGSNKSLAESQAETSKYNENLFKQSVIQLINNIQNNYQSDKLNTESLIKASSQLKINQSLTDLVSIGYRAGYMTYLNFQVQASSLYTAYSNLFSTQSTLVNNRLAFYSLYLFKDFEKTYSSLQNLSTPN